LKAAGVQRYKRVLHHLLAGKQAPEAEGAVRSAMQSAGNKVLRRADRMVDKLRHVPGVEEASGRVKQTYGRFSGTGFPQHSADRAHAVASGLSSLAREGSLRDVMKQRAEEGIKSAMLVGFVDELEKISADLTPIGGLMAASHHGVSPEALSTLPLFKQFKNVARTSGPSAAKRLGGRLLESLPSLAAGTLRPE
jgi:hypothetical protein